MASSGEARELLERVSGMKTYEVVRQKEMFSARKSHG